jgi:ribosome-binding protein aMBF1 (putative translation factor)
MLMKKKASRGRKTNDAMLIIDRLVGNDSVRRAGIADARLNLEVAQVVYDARKQAGLTQAQLARRIGTTQSVISRLEDSDYGAQSLSMLRRIARALDLYVHITLQPRPYYSRNR